MKNLEQESSQSNRGIIRSFQREVSHIFQRGASIGARLSLTLAVLAASENAFISTASAQLKESPPMDISDIPLYPTERSILNFPPAGSSEEQFRQFMLAAFKHSRRADSLDITGCEGSPVSFVIPIGQPEISITNTDAVDHNLYYNGVLRFSVPANGTTTFDTSSFQEDFDRGSTSLSVYNCDDGYPTPAGLFYVTPVRDNPQ